MMKISKITDYGIVVLTHIARHHDREYWTAKDLSVATTIPLPTVGKVLKILSRGNVLQSARGSQGGYKLTASPENLSLATVIEVLEGRLALTECSEKGNQGCGLHMTCVNKTNWQKINRAIYLALEKLSLADMARPLIMPLSGFQNWRGPCQPKIVQ